MERHRNLKKGDIVLLKYDAKYSPARYRLARVAETYPDHHDVVRTARVCVRDRRGTNLEKPTDCSTRKDFIRVAVQQLVVLLPLEEQGAPDPQTVATVMTMCQPKHS